MAAKTLVRLSAAIEMVTGVALIVAPGLVVTMLLGVGLSGSGIAVARLAGIALLCLAVACWPCRDDAAGNAIWALFTYNLLAALYLGYLKVDAGFAGYLLWPACAIHALLALLMARPAYREFHRKRATDKH